MSKIKKGDEVIVITGKDKGKRGKVLRVLPKELMALVDGINLIKKHVRPNPQANVQGGIVTREALLRLSKIKLYNPLLNKGDKVGFKLLEDGRKVRYFKSNNEIVDI